jgi:hypothetical protein
MVGGYAKVTIMVGGYAKSGGRVREGGRGG